MNPEAVSQVPKCPACGENVEYVRIILNKPFPCPSCGHQLMVLESYYKRVRFFCMAMAIAVGVAVTWRYCMTAPMTDAGIWRAFGLFWLTFYMTLTVVTIFGTIYVKRIFPQSWKITKNIQSKLTTPRCEPRIALLQPIVLATCFNQRAIYRGLPVSTICGGKIRLQKICAKNGRRNPNTGASRNKRVFLQTKTKSIGNPIVRTAQTC